MDIGIQRAWRKRTEPVQEIEQRAFALVNSHPHFNGRARRFHFHCHEDVLIVRGSVPTYYLKQMLQSVRVAVKGIRAVDNQVKVVSSQGLSSSVTD